MSATRVTSKAKSAKKAPTKISAKTTNKDHPSWKIIITECIVANPEDARQGVSRSIIKKYAEERYGLSVSATNLYQLNRAIQTGVDKGDFLLPKGPSGKVKLSAGAKASPAKENSKPDTVAKKPSGAKPRTAPTKASQPASTKAKSSSSATTAKKSTSTKKPAAKKPAPKKPAPKTKSAPKATTAKATTAKTTAKTTAAKATSSRKAPVKKVVKKTVTAPKKTSSTKTVAKKAAAKEAAKKAAKKAL